MEGEKSVWDRVVLIPNVSASSVNSSPGDARKQHQCFMPVDAEAVREALKQRRSSRSSLNKNVMYVTIGVASFALLSFAIMIFLLLYSKSHPQTNLNARANSTSSPRLMEDDKIDNVSIGGLYILERLGRDYPAFLKSLKMPEEVEKIVLKAGEVVEIVEPREEGGQWKIIRKTDYDEHELRFWLGEPFKFGRAGFSSGIVCRRPTTNELKCSIEEHCVRGLRQTTSLVFGEAGIVEKKVNLRTGDSGTRYFLRVAQDGATAEEYLGHDEEDEYKHEDDENYYDYDDDGMGGYLDDTYH